jgi:predicted ATPase
VAEICSRLDGLPLAIELAAARIKLLPPQALLQRLSSRLTLLTGRAKDRPTRQQTLRNTIDWSFALLSDDEQTLFARLSIFAGGCSLEAAEAVCNAEGGLNLLEGMASLVEQSLLQQEGEEEPRFRMLETIREYAAQRRPSQSW